MATRIAQRIPYGVGQLTGGWWVVFWISLALFGWGLAAWLYQYTQGLVVTGMRDIGTMGGAAWGIYIGFDVYFVGVSFAGITMAALIRLLNIEKLKAMSRMAELLTVLALPLAAFSVLVDLGRPGWGIINLLRYGRPESPFFGTVTMVISGYLFASLVYLYLAGRRDAYLAAQQPGRLGWFFRLWASGYKDTPGEKQRHARASYWLALAILPLLVTAHSTLGFIFGIQVGRPGWFSALQAPGFVILAGASGIGLLVIIAAVLRQALGLREQINLDVFRWLGNFLWVLTVVYLYFVVVEILTSTYTAHQIERRVSSALLTGAYAWMFWLAVGLLAVSFLILFVQFASHRYNILWVVVPAVLVNLASIFKRFLIVVPSQTHGTMLPYETGSYSPTWVEYSIIVGLFGLGTLLYAVFVKMFPITELPERA